MDHVLFRENFRGVTGRGVGVSYWTGLIVKLLHPRVSNPLRAEFKLARKSKVG